MAKSKAKGFFGGAAAGAAGGAALGSFVPGLGTLIGAGLGAGIGGIAGLADASTGSGTKYKPSSEVAKMQEAAQARARQEAENLKMVQEGLTEQLGMAKKGVGVAERVGRIAQQQAVEGSALARQQVRGGPRGAMGGASISAAARIAAETARARRDITAKTSDSVQRAQEKVAKAKEDIGVKKQELLAADAAKDRQIADSLADAEALFNSAVDDTIFIFDAGDRRTVAQKIRQQIVPGLSPEAIAAVEKYIEDEVLNPNNDVSWRIG